MNSTQFLRIKDVCKKTGLSRATVYAKNDPKNPRFDADFPKRVLLGDKAVAWVAAELEAWQALRINQREEVSH